MIDELAASYSVHVTLTNYLDCIKRYSVQNMSFENDFHNFQFGGHADRCTWIRRSLQVA